MDSADHHPLLSPLLLAAAGDTGYEWDVASDQMEWSGALLPFFGVSGNHFQINANEYRKRLHENDVQVFNALMLQGQAERIDRDYRLRLFDGTLAWVHERGQIEFDANGLPRKVRAVLRVVTARKMLEMDLTSRTRIDSLTGLPNRQHLLEMLDSVVAHARAHEQSVGYVVLAIDNMSYVNEAIGPDAGDRVILGVLKRVQEMIADVIEIGRVGGDQFGLILRDCDSHKLAELATQLLKSFREHAVDTPVCPVQVSVSMGGVIAPQSVSAAWEAMIRTEQALRDAQRQGRNSFVEYVPSEERVKAHRRTLDIGQQTLAALKNDGLVLAFQPLIEARTGKIVSFEALVRMKNEKGEFIPAGLFIPVIEQLGMANILDRRVVDLAIEAMQKDPELVLAINISGLTASQKGWPDIMREKLQHQRDVAKRLIVEVTETAAILDIEETKLFVDTVRALGGRVALDDFGAGFTSIRYLRTLSVNTLKIDRELLSNVTNDKDQQVMVRTLVGLARGLGLETVAEGVETESAARWLIAEGVDQLQGYYFGKPEVDLPANIRARFESSADKRKI